MRNLQNILNKYWEGKSSTTEETILNNELDNNSMDAESYLKMKKAFSELANLSTDKEWEKDFFTQLDRQKHKRKIYLHASISFAASAAITIGLFLFSYNKEAYVVENGVKHKDVEMAIEYADQAINEALLPLKTSMQSLEPIKGLEGSLSPTINNNAQKQTGSIIDKQKDSVNLR